MMTKKKMEKKKKIEKSNKITIENGVNDLQSPCILIPINLAEIV